MKIISQNEIKELINNFESLQSDEKEKVSNKIKENWHDLCDHFIEKCESDEVVTSAYDELKKAEKALAFDVVNDTAFRYISRILNEHDPEFRDIIYDFDAKRFNEAKSCYENWAQIQSQYDQKIKLMNSKKFVPFKESKLKKLEEELLRKKQLVSDYKYYLKQQSLKDHYMSKKEDLKQLQIVYNDLINQYAKETAFEAIKENPNLLCFSQSTFSSSKYQREFDLKPLKAVLDDMRYQALFEKEDEMENE